MKGSLKCTSSIQIVTVCILDFQISTAILMLVATQWGGAGMGFWHGARFYEYYRVSRNLSKLQLLLPSKYM